MFFIFVHKRKTCFTLYKLVLPLTDCLYIDWKTALMPLVFLQLILLLLTKGTREIISFLQSFYDWLHIIILGLLQVLCANRHTKLLKVIGQFFLLTEQATDKAWTLSVFIYGHNNYAYIWKVMPVCRKGLGVKPKHFLQYRKK